ncbi:MAG TPA: DUF2723 domain-containing protein [Phycisphaerae bacterium]|nr:DUF2723 domain-containing protein [Phycisphaerae bacterium]
MDRFALPIAVFVLLICTVTHLPPGICFDDAGDLQAAASALGIAHPPGYPGYVSLGYLLTQIPGVSPAYAVTLGCLGAGLTALALAGLMQIRLGANAWIAATLILALGVHPKVWVNVVIPEVYAPSLAFEVGAAYLLFRHLRLHRRRDLFLAALLVGVAFANRPPVGLALPAFALALWLGRRRRKENSRKLFRDLAWAALCFLLPCLYSYGYLYVRDTPASSYNYIERRDADFDGLPAANAGVRAKAQRLLWLTTGQEFRHSMGLRTAGLSGRLHWLTVQLGAQHDAVFIVVIIAIAFGLVLTNRRCPGCAVLLAGIALAAAIFICLYHVYDTAADVLPILLAATILVGTTLSALFPTELGRRRRILAVAIFLSTCAWTVYDARRRPDVAAAADATAFVQTADVRTLPANALIISSWIDFPPLWYAQHVLAGRADVRVVTANRRWLTLAREQARTGAAYPGPIFLTNRIAIPPGAQLTPCRNLWRIDPAPR